MRLETLRSISAHARSAAVTSPPRARSSRRRVLSNAAPWEKSPADPLMACAAAAISGRFGPGRLPQALHHLRDVGQEHADGVCQQRRSPAERVEQRGAVDRQRCRGVVRLLTAAAVSRRGARPASVPAGRPGARRRGPVIASMVENSSSGLSGFETYASMPAARHCSRSPAIACAVSAMIGMWPPVPRSRARMAAVASSPPISGICTSIRITSNGSAAARLDGLTPVRRPRSTRDGRAA